MSEKNNSQNENDVNKTTKRRKKMLYPGIILNIVRDSVDPLYTLFRIRYDVDAVGNEDGGDDDDEEIQTDFQYELMADYMNGNLKIIEE